MSNNQLTIGQQQELMPRALYALGLEFGATRKEVKSAYRKKAVETHPDKEGGSKSAFEVIKMAYDFLVEYGTERKAVPVAAPLLAGLEGGIFAGVTMTIRVRDIVWPKF